MINKKVEKKNSERKSGENKNVESTHFIEENNGRQSVRIRRKKSEIPKESAPVMSDGGTLLVTPLFSPVSSNRRKQNK